MIRICFVCLGNICRSPLAEGVFRHLAAAAGRTGDFHVESAGLGDWHVGEPPDSRARRVAAQHGVTLESRAQQFQARDFARFDVILAADEDIHAGLLRLAPDADARRKVHFLREPDPLAGADRDVPDPYYGDFGGFERVYALIERACRGWLERLSADDAGPAAPRT